MTSIVTNSKSWLAAIVLASAILAAVTIGCVNVNVDADSYARKYIAVADRASAIHIAKDRARQEGIQVDEYRTSAQEDKGAYWVTFDLITTGEPKGRPARFAVHVASDGSTEIHRNK
jgi:hypothetical protein